MSPSPVVLVLLLLASVGFAAAARGGAMLSSVPSTMIPLFPDSRDHTVTTKRPFHRKGTHVFGVKQLRNCMPKGFRHSSAPSRYANYEPLGWSARCSTPSATRP